MDEFLESIRNTDTADLELILSDQKDSYTEEELAVIAEELGRRDDRSGGPDFVPAYADDRDNGEEVVPEVAYDESFHRQYSAHDINSAVFSLDGVRGRMIEVYPYKCVITTEVTVGSIITNNATDGEKTIYFSDIIGIQYKEPGLTIGYIQFETASGFGNNGNNNFFNENTFTFSNDELETARKIYKYVIEKMDAYKSKQFMV